MNCAWIFGGSKVAIVYTRNDLTIYTAAEKKCEIFGFNKLIFSIICCTVNVHWKNKQTVITHCA